MVMADKPERAGACYVFHWMLVAGLAWVIGLWALFEGS
jgi:hypothetical protein